MSVNEQQQSNIVRQSLQSFLDMFSEYSQEIFGEHRQEQLDELRPILQRQEPSITAHLLDILGNGVIGIPRPFMSSTPIYHSDLLAVALVGGNNEDPLNFVHYKAAVTMLLNRAIGTIDAGLWPREEAEPVLIIKDNVLRERCSDLLRAPGNFDRLMREATTILEDRIRNKVPHEILSRLIPVSREQTGEKLVIKLFSPNNPVLIFSDNRDEWIAFHKMLIGVFAFIRNPHHHRLDDRIEWSWAWSIVGLIDRLLADVDSCVLAHQPNP